MLPIDTTKSREKLCEPMQKFVRRGGLFAKLLPIMFVPTEFDNPLAFLSNDH